MNSVSLRKHPSVPGIGVENFERRSPCPPIHSLDSSHHGQDPQEYVCHIGGSSADPAQRRPSARPPVTAPRSPTRPPSSARRTSETASGTSPGSRVSRGPDVRPGIKEPTIERSWWNRSSADKSRTQARPRCAQLVSPQRPGACRARAREEGRESSYMLYQPNPAFLLYRI